MLIDHNFEIINTNNNLKFDMIIPIDTPINLIRTLIHNNVQNYFNLNNYIISIQISNLSLNIDENSTNTIYQKYYYIIRKMKFSITQINHDINNQNNQEYECNICLENIYDDIYISICRHHYHINCINRWLNICIENNRQPNCPICRNCL
jgi:hypothetical protein